MLLLKIEWKDAKGSPTSPPVFNFEPKQLITFFKKMGQPRPLFCLFSVFSNKHYNFYVKKCPSSIWCWDSNPRPLESESLPITTRPGLPPCKLFITVTKHSNLFLLGRHQTACARCVSIDVFWASNVISYFLQLFNRHILSRKVTEQVTSTFRLILKATY